MILGGPLLRAETLGRVTCYRSAKIVARPNRIGCLGIHCVRHGTAGALSTIHDKTFHCGTTSPAAQQVDKEEAGSVGKFHALFYFGIQDKLSPAATPRGERTR